MVVTFPSVETKTSSPSTACVCGDAATNPGPPSGRRPRLNRTPSRCSTSTAPRERSAARLVSVAPASSPSRWRVPSASTCRGLPASGGGVAFFQRSASRLHLAWSAATGNFEHAAASCRTVASQRARSTELSAAAQSRGSRLATARHHEYLPSAGRALISHGHPSASPAMAARVATHRRCKDEASMGWRRLGIAGLRGIEDAAGVADEGVVADRLERVAEQRLDVRALRDAGVHGGEGLNLGLEVAGRRRRIDLRLDLGRIHAQRMRDAGHRGRRRSLARRRRRLAVAPREGRQRERERGRETQWPHDGHPRRAIHATHAARDSMGRGGRACPLDRRAAGELEGEARHLARPPAPGRPGPGGCCARAGFRTGAAPGAPCCSRLMIAARVVHISPSSPRSAPRGPRSAARAAVARMEWPALRVTAALAIALAATLLPRRATGTGSSRHLGPLVALLYLLHGASSRAWIRSR